MVRVLVRKTGSLSMFPSWRMVRKILSTFNIAVKYHAPFVMHFSKLLALGSGGQINVNLPNIWTIRTKRSGAIRALEASSSKLQTTTDIYYFHTFFNSPENEPQPVWPLILRRKRSFIYINITRQSSNVSPLNITHNTCHARSILTLFPES